MLRRLVIIVIFSLAFFFRANLLFTQEFSLNERFSYSFAVNNSFIDHIVSPPDDRPPLYYSLIKLLIPISNSKEFLRLSSLLFSMISIVYIYKIFEFFSKRTALYALIFSSTHSLLIHVSWQVRDYSLLTMLSVLVVYFLVKILTDIYSHKIILKKDIVCLLLTTLAGVLTSYLFYPFIGIVLFVFGILIFSIRKKIDRINISLLQKMFLGIFPIVIVAIYYVIDGFQRVINLNQLANSHHSDVFPQIFLELFSMPGYWFLTNNVWVPLTMLSLFSIIILYVYFKIDYKNNQKILIQFFSFSLILSVLSYLLFSEFLVNLLIPRAWVALIVFFIFIIVVGWSYLEKFLSKWISKKILMLVFSLLFFVIGIFQYGVRYELWGYKCDYKYNKYNDIIYPFPNDRLMTTLVKTVESYLDESTQLITLPDYEMIIFDYEWRNRDLKNNYKQISSKFATIGQEIESYDDLFDSFLESSNQHLKLIIVMDKLPCDDLFKHDDPFAKAHQKLFDFINQNCETKWSEEIMGAYNVWGCELLKKENK